MTIDMSINAWQRQHVVKQNGEWTVDGRPIVSIKITQRRNPLNMPNLTWLTLVITAPGGAATPPHTHNGASIIATIIKGKMLNQMVHDGRYGHSEGPKIYEQGESWYEAPGCHHVRSENVGEDGAEAVFVASLVIEGEKVDGADGDEELLQRVFLLDADA
ncbi:uncharacterized protein AB675_1378 [Cyphellophora attinorum]|uniref:Cupin type-1 domain-containing protein n=1 Tax=Cyphellophora attinorum TaxID=1664694 RepID=A0A0N0NHU8_9EURO|nr:uncharacterized protein AB675_1378 [Phialophora attinorum]KPI35091.1 hypothetical protein AB675_1378 [Phialophora attinorum]